MLNIPEGYQTVSPYFYVNDPLAFADFLSDAFGAEEKGRTMSENGIIANMQIRIGTVTIMLSQASDAWPAMAGAFYIYVEDADVSMQKALDAGAEQLMAVADMSYGDRQGGVRDLAGNIWWISQRLTDKPYDD